MTLFVFVNVWLLLSIIGQILGISYNLPTFCANATWNQTALTFATSALVGTYPLGIFIDTNNTIYVADRSDNRIVIWLKGSTTPARNISGGLNGPYPLFVTDNDDVYVDNSYANYRIDKWAWNTTNSVPAMYVCSQCYGIFVDINNMLYCSMYAYHQVIYKSLTQNLNVWTTVAGVSNTAGSTSTTLNNPCAIFVDNNLNLYVADYANSRIQKFASGQLNGTTISTGAIALYHPTGVILDGGGYVFIVDNGNHRLIGSGPNGFRCIAACSGYGSSSSQLYYPQSMSFDSYGNIFVTDQYNNRIQKFLLLTNSCNETTTTTTTVATVTLMNNNQLGSLTTTAPGISSTTVTYSNPISYNMPKFTAYTTWSSNGITFANTTVVGTYPYGVFVDNNNTVYVCEYSLNRVQAWSEGSSKPTRNISGNLNSPYTVFVTSNGDVYVDNGYANSRVDKWAFNTTNSTVAMNVKNFCCGLFVDINNNLYCTMYGYHQVNIKSLNSNSNMWTVAAGTGCAGSTSNMLYNPRGIFVDTDLNLYVADFTNNRVQKFLSQQVNGITIAGTGATGTISLNGPAGVVLDADGYVFIAEYYNNRIVGSGPNGFRCLVGCSTVAASASNQLYYPTSLSFDSYGNIFVADQYNHRIQKFYITSNVYGTTINQPNLCPSTTWYTNAITFANSSTAGAYVYGVFVGIDNTVYVANLQTNKVVIWFEESTNPDKILSGSLSASYDLFATPLGDIYVDNGLNNRRIDKFSLNSNISNSVMTVPYACTAIFVDISNTLYCSAFTSHQVVKKWLNDSVLTSTIVAGTGTAGSTATTLNAPIGIVVDAEINLYVADSLNNRIQMFPIGQFTGITLAGASVPGTITLNQPNGITLDGNGYLFIADCYNNRIIGSGPYGFRCLFGCATTTGSSSSQLSHPVTLRFDSYGNLFVADCSNSRILKFIIASNSCSLSYNQPTFCSNALWYSNASTFASSSTIGTLPYGIFINGINTVYVPNRVSNTILSWPQWSTTSTSNSYSNLSNPYSLFMSITGDIYIDNGYSYGRVDKYIFNTSNRVTVMNVNGSCYGLFIDINNNLYCSLKNLHQVVKLLLNNGTTIPTIAAGNGSAGPLSNMLNSPQGIYVDSNLNLYIADSANNRIQFIQTGQLDGVTVVGNGSSANITLNYPTGIVLDANGYLFIVDSYNHRIIASSYYGFRCIVGCSGGGSSASQLSFPQSMAFDSYGNIYITDRNNSRVQQFALQNNSCRKLSQYRPPPLLRAAAAVPQLALPLLPRLRLQAVAVLQVPLPPPPVPLVALPLPVLRLQPPVLQAVLLLPPPVPQVPLLLLLLPPQVLQRVAAVPQLALPRAVVVPQVPLLRRPLLAAPLRAVAVPQVVVQRVAAVPQAAPLLPAVPQVALPPPPAVLQQVVVVPQVAVQRVVAALQVLLLQVAAVPQAVLPPPPVLQVALLLPLPPLVLPRVAVVPQVGPQPRPLLAVPLQAVAALQVAVPQLVLPLPLVVPHVARLPS
ncbi:unnamed protein product [Adineta steineri]|uniref:NHL repeat containing protein n=1 Tax=Adineta steineri TaxID=433720 RepID=A0A814Q488_9BILA|nr:unnamed protein product [Adineta steineri]CAF3728306.1 unnamed protein product [Adineta steineri]CAF3892019.1 unnamed protein product [Adineta steineri]